MFKYLLFLFFVTKFVNCYNHIYECAENTPTYNLTENSITLFQSPNFPQSISTNQSSSTCNVLFSTQNSSINIWIVMLNGFAREIQFRDTRYISNNLNVTEYISSFDTVKFTTFADVLAVNVNTFEYTSTKWTAFQAIVVTFPKITNSKDCPLASQTFDFSADPNLVIPVASTFTLSPGSFSYILCNWIFNLGKNQKLKIVVKSINLADKITITLVNEKMITYSISNKDLNQAFHISGQRFTLTYTFNHANSSESGFLLFVSAVTESNTTTSVGCRLPQINSTSQRTIFTNINYKDGYQPNQKCVSDVTLPEKHEARLYISEYDFEGPADQLILTYGNSEQIPLTWKPRKARYFYKLTSDINDAKLNFISDGNIQGAGYTAYMETFECNCSNSNFVIQCGNSADITPMNFINQYCSNMDCNYTIIANSSCPDSYFSIALNNYMRDSIDYLIITNNGKMTENITAASGHLNRYFSSKNNSVTIQFHSGPSSDPVTIEDKMWSISVSTMVAPVFVTKTLNETIPKYVQWLSDMGENDALTICTTSGTLEMFVSYIKDDFDLSNVLLYDGGDLNNFVGSLNKISTTPFTDLKYPQNIKSSSGCFTLYLPSTLSYGRGYSALFRIAEEASKNCQNPNNVFQAPSDFLTVSEFDASISSTQSGACEMTILASVGYTSLLPHVWISNISASTNAKYLVYSTVNEKKLFEFNGTEASQWQYVGIYSPAVTIKASASSTISIRLSEVYQTLEWINVVMNGTQKGIMASPSYSGSIRTYNFGSFYQSNGYSKFLTTFNVKEIDGNAKPILQNGGKNQTLTQGIYNTSGAFVLYYEETDPSKNAFLIDYTIQSGPLNPPNSAIMSSFLNTYFIFVLSALFFVLNI